MTRIHINNRIKTILQTIILTWRKFCQDDCFNHAAGLAYTTLLSLVPLLAVSFSILSAFPVYHDITQKIQNLIFSYIVTDSAQIVQQHFLNFIAQTLKLSAVGIVGLLITAILLVFSMERTFNNIWHINCHRRGITAFLLYWAVITLIPIVVASLLSICSYLTGLTEINNTLFYITENLINIILPYFAAFVAFVLLYLTLPNCKVPISSAVSAAIIATTLFELARYSFTLYINNFAGYELIYGAFAAIPIFLVWLYVSWVIILFGVVVSYVLTNHSQ